ncbi:hypothetical protein OUZ56_024206 [Daphnia magna]|uniref:Uncharacterized protein n=1 Tax=Daphnia magna TaxID=35525 RepID=A0ABR0B0B6_9CRUS|nr:hypothetical protein OUZ56_024206 [Daphnia magna]
MRRLGTTTNGPTTGGNFGLPLGTACAPDFFPADAVASSREGYRFCRSCTCTNRSFTIFLAVSQNFPGSASGSSARGVARTPSLHPPATALLCRREACGLSFYGRWPGDDKELSFYGPPPLDA